MTDDLIIAGVDPGSMSLAICWLVNGRIAHVYQHEVPRRERKEVRALGDEVRHSKWVNTLVNNLSIVPPTVVGIEIVEHQPWRAGGRIPKGVRDLEKLVLAMQVAMMDKGWLAYPQSPDIQAGYPDAVIDSMLREGFSYDTDFEITPHLRSATKHALYADSYYRRLHAIPE